MDVIFLIDTSGSMGEEGFKKEVDFIKKFVPKFNFGPGEHQSQFAIVDSAVLTGQHVEVLIHLNDYDNADDFLKAVTYDLYRGMGAQPWMAMEKTRNDVLKPENGARANVKTILILLSDGDPEIIKRLEEESTKLKAMDVAIFSLIVDLEEEYVGKLRTVVSEPPEEHMFQMKESDKFTNKISTLVTEICWGKVEMWIHSTGKLVPTDSECVMTTMDAAFTSEMRPKAEQHTFVCETDKVYMTEKEKQKQMQ